MHECLQAEGADVFITDLVLVTMDFWYERTVTTCQNDLACWLMSFDDEDAPFLVQENKEVSEKCLRQMFQEDEEQRDEIYRPHHNFGLDGFGFFQDSFNHDFAMENFFNVRKRQGK